MSKAGAVFLSLGLAVGLAGAVALGAGVTVDLPPWLQTLIAFKLLFIGSGCLLILGAVLRRRGLRHDADDARAAGSDRRGSELPNDRSRGDLGAGAPPASEIPLPRRDLRSKLR